jgi:transposase InsO family protein
VKFSFINAEKAQYPVAWMCHRLEVSRSGFYAWLRRPDSQHQKRDQYLAVRIVAIHAENHGVYGSPRVHDELKDSGESVSRKRVSRLMKQQGLSGNSPKRFIRTTDSSHPLPVADNVLNRQFSVEALNRVWAGDITYIHTWEGWLYLAILIDVCSRRVVGFAMADNMRTELPLKAWRMAVGQRCIAYGKLLHHSDRGIQYASFDYQEAIAVNGTVCSMSRKGNCWDNAVSESFFATLKSELIHRKSWPTRDDATSAINEYISCFYNPRRKHSSLGYLSPMEYETKLCSQRMAA